jgi:hypothetical protein
MTLVAVLLVACLFLTQKASSTENESEDSQAVRIEAVDATEEQSQLLEAENTRLRGEVERLRKLVPPAGRKPSAVVGSGGFTSGLAIVQTVPDNALPDRKARNERFGYSAVHQERLRKHFQSLADADSKVNLKMKVANPIAKSRNTPENRGRELGYAADCEVVDGKSLRSGSDAYVAHAGTLWHLRFRVEYPTSREQDIANVKAGDVIAVAGTIRLARYREFADVPVKHNSVELIIDVPKNTDSAD